jgi:hypothetical protein
MSGTAVQGGSPRSVAASAQLAAGRPTSRAFAPRFRHRRRTADPPLTIDIENGCGHASFKSRSSELAFAVAEGGKIGAHQGFVQTNVSRASCFARTQLGHSQYFRAAPCGPRIPLVSAAFRSTRP